MKTIEKVNTFLGLEKNTLSDFDDWNFLMELVNIIESIDLSEYHYEWKYDEDVTYNNFYRITVEIEKNTCWIFEELVLDPFNTLNVESMKVTHETKKEAVQAAILEFIDYYNKLKKNEN